jgi:hypothetical protein
MPPTAESGAGAPYIALGRYFLAAPPSSLSPAGAGGKLRSIGKTQHAFACCFALLRQLSLAVISYVNGADSSNLRSNFLNILLFILINMLHEVIQTYHPIYQKHS